MRIFIIAISMLALGSCSSYEYRPFVDSVDACFSKEDLLTNEVDTKCYSQATYTDLDKIHEMSPTDSRYLPTPSD